MKKLSFLFFGIIALSLGSCVNEEGEGGTSIVEGKIFKVIHRDDIYTFDVDTVPAAKEDVYIVYGGDEIYGDKMETGYDGFFRFKYLTKGTYKIYAYSTLKSGIKQAVFDTVTVGSGKTQTSKNIYIHEGKAQQTSFIKGTVMVKYYNKGNAITALKPAYDVRVMIRVKGAPYQFDEVRTGLDGVFMFQNLSVGEYEVFVFTEDPVTEALSPIIQTIIVDKEGIIATPGKNFEIIVTV